MFCDRGDDLKWHKVNPEVGKIVFEGEECIKEYNPPPPKRESRDITQMFKAATAKRPRQDKASLVETQQRPAAVHLDPFGEGGSPVQHKSGYESGVADELAVDKPLGLLEQPTPRHSTPKGTPKSPSKVKRSPGARTKDGKVQLGIKSFFK